MGPAGILESSTGHCGTFNLALVYACKVRGIPARAITGAWAEPEGGNNGHITSEVWIDGVGWMVSDSTNGGIHLDAKCDGWSALSNMDKYFGWNTMSATQQDIADS